MSKSKLWIGCFNPAEARYGFNSQYLSNSRKMSDVVSIQPKPDTGLIEAFSGRSADFADVSIQPKPDTGLIATNRF